MYRLYNSVPVAYMGKVRMEMGKLSPINKDDLKVGDVIGVAREGWGTSFRTISGNPRQFNYRDESAGLCISAH